MNEGPGHMKPRSNAAVIHYWGEVNGERRVVACTKGPLPTWRTTGAMLRVTCPRCLEILHRERCN